MPYGIIKVDTITFTDGGVDKSVAISGLVQNPTFTGNVTVTGTVSGATVRATTVSGVTISGTTVNAASGVFTTQISGEVVVAPAGTVSAPSVQVGTGASIAPGFYGAGTDQLGVSTGGSSRLIIDSVGQIRVVTLGSAAAPALVVGNDINTGIYSPGADQIGISTNGAGRLFIDSSGGVGIGTSSPTQPLQVAGNVRIGLTTAGAQYSTLSVLGDAAVMSSAPLFNFTTADGSTRFAYIYHGGSGGNFEILNQQSGALTFGTNNTERLRINSSGNVGIGTTAPSELLHVAGTARIGANGSSDAILEIGAGATGNRNAYIDLVSDTTYSDYGLRLIRGNAGANSTSTLVHRGTGPLYINCEDGGSIGFSTNNTERLRITSAGLVGLGTSAPLEFIDVRRANGAGDLAVRLVHEGQVEYKIGIKDSDDKLYITNNNGNTALGATTGIIVTSAGSVGIGTASPGAALDVQGNIRLSASAPNIEFNNGGAMIYGPSANTLAFATGGGVSSPVEKARIDSSGRLLVGTSSRRRVGTPFDPVGGVFYEGSTNSSYEAFTAVVNRTDNVGAVLSFGKSGGSTNGSNTIVANGDQLGVIRFSGADGTDLESIAAEIVAEVDGNPGPNDMPGRLVFSTTADGASSPAERMRITNGGDVRIGTAAALDVGSGTDDGFRFLAPSTAAGIFQCSNNDAVGYFRRRSSDGIMLSFRRDTTQVGTISVTTTATAYNTSSDYRLKENITPVTNGITRLQQLKPSRFNFIADPTKTVDGFIAHEVQSVVPEAITGEKDAVDADGNPEYQGIDQSKLVPLLTAALQEAIAKIETLEARLTALESA